MQGLAQMLRPGWRCRLPTGSTRCIGGRRVRHPGATGRGGMGERLVELNADPQARLTFLLTDILHHQAAVASGGGVGLAYASRFGDANCWDRLFGSFWAVPGRVPRKDWYAERCVVGAGKIRPVFNCLKSIAVGHFSSGCAAGGPWQMFMLRPSVVRVSAVIAAQTKGNVVQSWGKVTGLVLGPAVLLAIGVVVAGDASAASGQLANGSGLCATPYGGGTANGTLVTQWSCNGDAAQNWYWSGSEIVNDQSGRCLTPYGGSLGNGTYLTLWDCNGSPSQQWHRSVTTADLAVSAGGSTAYITSYGGSRSNGAYLTLWSASGGQTWDLGSAGDGTDGGISGVSDGGTTAGTPTTDPTDQGATVGVSDTGGTVGVTL